MYALDYFRMSQIKTLIITHEFLLTLRKRTAMVILLCQPVFLDHGTHRTIQNIYLIVVENHILQSYL